MNKNYYLKSILRVIKKNPIQPILITFIFILAFIVANISLTLSKAFTDNEDGEYKSKYGNSEIVLSSNSKSGSRFIFASDILEILPDATVTGSFTVPFVCEDSLVNGIAVNYENINSLFAIDFISYQSFNINSKESVAFVSNRYATNNNLNVGDKIVLSLFGSDKEFYISGISKIPFMGSNDIVCDTSAVISSFAETSNYISLFTSDYDLYGKIYIKTSDNIDDAINKLKVEFPDYSIELVTHDVKSTKETISEAISLVMVFLCFVTTFAVILTSTYSLNKQRKELCDLFNYAGLSKKKLTIYKSVEMLIYSLIGALLGTMLSVVIGKMFYSFIGFIYIDYEFNSLYAIINVVVLTLCAVIPPIIYEYKVEKKKNSKVNKWFIIMPIIALILFIITFFVRGKYKFTLTMFVLSLAFLSIAILFDSLIKNVAKWFSKKEKNPIKRIAFKNCFKIGEIANIAKLLVMLASIVSISLTFVLTSIATNVVGEKLLSGDYAVSGGGANVYDKLNQLDCVESVNGFYTSLEFSTNNKDLFVWASSSLDNFGSLCSFDYLPQGNEIITTKAYAAKYNYKKGDIIKVYYNGVSKDFVIKDTTNGGEFCFLVDIDYIEQNYNFYFVNGKSDISKENLYERITSVLATDMVTVVKPVTLMDYILERQTAYICFCSLISIIILVFGAIGVYNNVSEGSRARRVEFDYYSLCGMSQKGIKKMRRTEVCFSVILMIVLTLSIGTMLVLVACQGMMSYGSSPLDLIRLMIINK